MLGAAARAGTRLRQRAASVTLSWNGMSTAAATPGITSARTHVVARASSSRATGPSQSHPTRLWPGRPVNARRGYVHVTTRASSSDTDAASTAESTAGSTVSEHARGYGTVVTSQANFLRVVVTRESMTQAHLDERALQLTNAMDRASQAGKTADVAKLQEVLADEGPYELLCVVRALLKKIKQRVLVGDAVDVLGIDWVDRRAMVETVHTRRSSLVDPPVANVDHALLVFALERPPLEAKQLTRFLVSMEATGVPFTLVLNKCDLCDETTRADWGARLEQWGYYPRFVSVATGEGVDELEAELAVGMSHNRALDGSDGDGAGSIDDDDNETDEAEGRTSDTGVAPRSVTVLAGPSGVGKSSLINRLRAGSKLAEALAAAGELEEENGDCAVIGENETNELEGDDDNDTDDKDTYEDAVNRFITDVDISGGGGGARGSITLDGLELQSVKAVSSKLGRGRHTTRHVTLLPLKSGGLLADTPGFGYPSLTSITTNTLPDCFPEIVRAKAERGACKFSDCTHRDEPGCVVDEVMPWEEDRYDFYADMFDEVAAIEKVERERGKRVSEQRTKYKSGKGGNQSGGTGQGQGQGGSKESKRNARRSEASRDNARMEAKLETKTHRRQSRRSRNMETNAIEARDLSEWDDEDEDE